MRPSCPYRRDRSGRRRRLTGQEGTQHDPDEQDAADHGQQASYAHDPHGQLRGQAVEPLRRSRRLALDAQGSGDCQPTDVQLLKMLPMNNLSLVLDHLGPSKTKTYGNLSPFHDRLRRKRRRPVV